MSLQYLRTMIKGVIFDMDGVLVDNMRAHFEAFAELAKRYHITESPCKDFGSLNGRGNEDVIRALVPAEIVEAHGVEALGREK